MNPYATRTQEEMKDVLMSPESVGPEIHYYMIRGGDSKKNITVCETGTVGGEYIKTYGHYHITDFKETYWLLEGEAILLMQARKKDQNGEYINDEIESFQALKIKAGDQITIPPFTGHLLVNIGKTWLTTSDDSPVNLGTDSASMPQHADYSAVKKMRGFAYYVIEQNGVPTLIKNSLYKSVPEASIVEYK